MLKVKTLNTLIVCVFFLIMKGGQSSTHLRNAILFHPEGKKNVCVPKT